MYGTGFFPQPLHIAHRWIAEELFVLAIEVGSIFISHMIASSGRIKAFTQHQTAGLLKSQAFLKLQRTHRRDRLEMARAYINTFAN
jgi:hypothetical protein